MRNKIKFITFFLISQLILSTAIKAQIITIKITAQITTIEDGGNFLRGQLKTGDSLIGTYTYDSSAPDQEYINNQAGVYNYSGLPYGINLAGEGLNFQTNLNNSDFVIVIENYYDGDYYRLGSHNNIPIFGNTAVTSISLSLKDKTATTLNNDLLPTSAPILQDWPDAHYLIIEGGLGGRDHMNNFGILANLTCTELVPEPATIALISLGTLFLRRRKLI